MDTTRNPESMTATERRDEIASILARGMVRAVRQTRSDASSALKSPAESSDSGLDLCADLPLSVAPRPAGQT
ncbi:MAG: hypothetical protein EA376_03800 [Phycisphaeraceae bacterium]|nr:MAG: hypothetical protein EA376_03800 [Phycisphaeraceae bacterium]